MNRYNNSLFLPLLLLFSCIVPAQAKVQGTSPDGNFDYIFSGKFKPEMFFGKNIGLLNNDNPDDKVWYMRHTLDFNFDVLYGAKTYNRSVAELMITMRNKSVWGNRESIARITTAPVKILDVVTGEHNHALARHVFWMREGWLRLDLAQVMGLNFDNRQEFTLGAFPFQLGRGISLGDAYSVNPGLLGFYTDDAIDQYAFGAKVSGDLVKNILSYDIYTAILQNKSSNLGDVGRRILGQEFGKRLKPQRGFGKVDYLVAGRLRWNIFDHKRYGKLNLESYGLFYNDPEQKIEFLGDASSRLGTIGAALAYTQDKVEFGFECAINVGNQKVKGWDRNTIQFSVDADTGFVKEINSHVVDEDGNNITYNPSSSMGKEIQTAINNAPQSESQNGQEFSVVDGMPLINKTDRFRNPYTNLFQGWMFVADLATWIYKKDLKLAFELGVASGDDNPNTQTKDGDFTGFIPIQSIYSGKSVRSDFVLGGRLKRLVDAPQFEERPRRFVQQLSGFTNIIYCGSGLNWEPKGWSKKFAINPNILAFWQEKPTRKFDAFTKKFLDERASTYLGLELNTFANCYILENLNLYFVGALVFPGSHFTDIRGIPLNSEQDKALDRLDPTGVTDRIPNLGDDTAFTFNIGLEFKF